MYLFLDSILYKQGIPSVFFIICFPFFVKRYRRKQGKIYRIERVSLVGIMGDFRKKSGIKI